jgi:hypothetical protein
MMAKYLLWLMLGCSAFVVKGQSLLIRDSVSSDYLHYQSNRKEYLDKWTGFAFDESKMITLTTHDPGFSKTFLVDGENRTVDQGYAPGSYYTPNHNRLVINGRRLVRDSFNPYGALNIGEAIFLGTLNQFITKIGKSRRKHPPGFHR